MFKLIWLIRDRNEWKHRAEAFESKLDDERKRNRHFEREMISRLVTLAGQVGIAQEARQIVKPQTSVLPEPTAQTINSLSVQQQEDLQMYLDDAEKNGRSANEAWKDFYNREIFPMVVQDELIDVEN